MNKLALGTILAASVSLLAVAPAAAEEVMVPVSYGDLDIASPAGAATLAARVEATCERPDTRDLKGMSAWEQCKDSALASAAEQLAGKGVAVHGTLFAAI
jgi:UrcA family protein